MRSKLAKIFALIVTLILIIQIPLLMKSEIRAEFKDPETSASNIVLGDKKFNFQTLGSDFEVKPFDHDGVPTSSSIVFAELGVQGLETKNHQSEGVVSDVLFSADSMTKMVTAAATLRMTEEEKYQKFLPKGIETKLSDLLPLLKKHYPDSKYIQKNLEEELELNPDLKGITLAHLAQHTSGLASTFKDSFLNKILQNPNQKLTPDEMLDVRKADRTGKWGEKIGEYLYNNIDYELLGRIVVAVANEAAGEQKDDAKIRKFGDVVEELVISRVREKAGEEEKKDQSEVSLRFFTSDQMEIVDGKTRVIGHPELRIQFGKHYHDGQFQEVPSHSYDLASGGSYVTAGSMSKIAFHILHSDSKFSVFKKPETLEIFNSHQVPQFNKDGTSHPQYKTYGFGYESYYHPDYLDYARYRTHGGGGYGSNSNSFVDTKENKVAVVMVGFENLTLPLAYALTNKERAEAPIRLSPELYQKSLELVRNYSESQLVEMRQGLEKSYEKFQDIKLAIDKSKKTIAIFAPSWGNNDKRHLDSIEKQKDFIKSSGFNIDCPDDLMSPPIKGVKWANTPEERARRIINILNNPEIVAMWATDGGESAIEVINLLNEYDKNPEEIKKQITESYLKTHDALPENFFLPERHDLLDYSQGALPKRGIYCVGMSDVSGINNFLGQRGIASPLYADGLLFPNEKNSKEILKIISGERQTSKYEGLTLLGGGEFSNKDPLEIYATVDGWIASSCGTQFQFTLQKPSILAIESIEEGNVVGLTLQQAFEAGALANVKAIVIGRIKGGQIGGDLEKYPALKEFVEKSGIAVFTTNGTLQTGENTFGHGKGGITEPFANFANASLDKQEDGSYNLEISGNRSQENLNYYYQSRQPVANRAKVFFDHPQILGNISINAKDLQPINSGNEPNLSGSTVVHANYRELRLTNGTSRQADLQDKVLIVSGNDGSDDEKYFLHQSLVENHLSGNIAGTKAIIIAMPAYHEKNTIETLRELTNPLPYKQDEQGNYL